MLGCKQQRHPKLFYSLIDLDERIRPDNPLRRIHDIIDFSFVRPQVEHFYGCPYRKFGPSLFTRVYVQSPDHDKLSQMGALSRKRPQEIVILS